MKQRLLISMVVVAIRSSVESQRASRSATSAIATTARSKFGASSALTAFASWSGVYRKRITLLKGVIGRCTGRHCSGSPEQSSGYCQAHARIQPQHSHVPCPGAGQTRQRWGYRLSKVQVCVLDNAVTGIADDGYLATAPWTDGRILGPTLKAMRLIRCSGILRPGAGVEVGWFRICPTSLIKRELARLD
jgi:hypothetical protein